MCHKEPDMKANPSPPANVFEFLDESHREIQRQLVQLRELIEEIETDGLSSAHKPIAQQVLHYFNREARQHHLDEETHIFPALLSSGVPDVVHAAKHLTQDHGWLEENWLQIEPALEAAANGNQWFDAAELRHALDVFEALYTDHIILEESLAYPEAKKRLGTLDTTGSGREMARRRALASQGQNNSEIA